MVCMCREMAEQLEVQLSILPKEGLYFPPPLDKSIENTLELKNDGNKVDELSVCDVPSSNVVLRS